MTTSPSLSRSSSRSSHSWSSLEWAYQAPVLSCWYRVKVPPADHRIDVEDEVWPFWPQQMRIHPLTQFVTDRKSGDRLVEVRIEFVDGYGHTTKAVGQFDVELRSAATQDPVQEPLGAWDRNLRDMEINRDHYDDVTQTYLFRLNVQNVEIPEDPELRAYFSSGDGWYLQATYQLRR